MGTETRLKIEQTSELVARLDAIGKEVDGLREFAMKHELTAVEDLCHKLDVSFLHFADEHLKVSIVTHCSASEPTETSTVR